MSEKQEKAEEYYSPKEFGFIMGVHQKTVLRWCRTGDVAATRVGVRGRIRIPTSELQRLRTRRMSTQIGA